MLEVLDAQAVRRWSATALELLEAGCSDIDALNVFPVPDGDTGTNMLSTMRAAGRSLDAVPDAPVVEALAAMAEGAAAGAVGNSGFILSQILRGLAEAVAAAGQWDAGALAAGLLGGAELGRQAVMNPLEGTILSVAAAAAAHARGDSLAEAMSAAVAGADAALLRTPGQLAVLARAGVVDAGGRGLLVLLDALARTVTGRPAALTPIAPPTRELAEHDPPVGPEYEVQYLLDSVPAAVDGLRSALDELGDSVAVVAAGERTWKVHVHVDDIGAALERGLEAGRPYAVSVVPLAAPRRSVDDDTGARAVLAVAPGPGLAHLFESEGVHVVDGHVIDRMDGSSAGVPPSIADVLDVIRTTGASELVLLPNASQVTGIAEAAARLARARGVRVSVVPTRSPVQGLAAIAVHDPTRRFDDDVVAMAEAAAATRFAQVTVARSEALTAVGICQPGDVLGMIDGEVVDIGRGLLAVAFGLVDRLLAVGAELMTIVVGTDAPSRTGELIEAHVRGRAALTDVSVYQGGQADHPVIIGVE
ncbi:DAK2 domain-containing protein [uncultured Jatrophihabitans sp.]|uniref:DAK2 domain-containing protein n=1 Tax=uncultured Jatrophihabitans sp. TaxID=1610747 RepID=UPI0035CBAE57